MIKLLHNTLPTKAKIYKRIKNEKEQNKTNGTSNTFWQSKYPHIKNNLCTFCKKEPETAEHLMTCKHQYVKKQYDKALTAVQGYMADDYVWFLCKETSSPRRLKGFEPVIENKGIIPKKLLIHIAKARTTPKKFKEAILNIQIILINAHLKIWKRRNIILFNKYKERIT